ncbi:MAG: anaerobic ribonucleoside-triphosphate reductase activating protein, partial [Christensenellaceae bacterium]|nr:anaerobic ribonucleoside-triphosphate reductase activating protein [Christensenellaceae bacterium]
MKIQGLQKLTLLDYPGKVAATVFLGGCNFRCPFCHNAQLVLPARRHEAGEMSSRELLAFLQKRKGILDGICITGGEPLMEEGAEQLMAAIKELDFALKLDTNGSYPARLKALVADGLVDYVAMDIKNAPGKYAMTAGYNKMDISGVCESVDFLLSGAVDYEFRTTVVRELHTRQDLLDIGKWIRGAKRYFLQTFIDSGDLVKPSGFSAYCGEDM